MCNVRNVITVDDQLGGKILLETLCLRAAEKSNADSISGNIECTINFVLMFRVQLNL